MSENEYEEEGGDDLGWAETPSSTKGLRACKRCSLVKGNDQLKNLRRHEKSAIDLSNDNPARGHKEFVQNGCENCHFLQMESDQARVQDCTTTYFSGMIGMIDPSDSWVAKWQQIGGCRSGMYAIEVIGELPAEVLEFLEEKGIPYACKPPNAAR